MVGKVEEEGGETREKGAGRNGREGGKGEGRVNCREGGKIKLKLKES